MLDFKCHKDVLCFVMHDCLEEFRTILVYEIANLELVASSCFLWNARCDKLIHIDMELSMLISERVFCEHTYLDNERVT